MMFALASLFISTSYALVPYIPVNLPYKCKKWDLSACTNADLADPNTRHIVIVPTGFSATEESAFWTDFDTTIKLSVNAGTAWTAQKKTQILWVGWFDPSGPVDSPTAAFGATIPPHPVRGSALSLDNEAVYRKVDSIRGTLTNLRPLCASVLFNYTGPGGVTANAAPPNFIQKPYGIAKMTRFDLPDRGAYIPVHEMAHAGLSFLDEYIEAGFENLDIHSLDNIMPVASLDGTWTGFTQALADLVGYYDLRFSEALANVGNDNVSTVRYPATVNTSGFPNREDYNTEGGMFFGKGTHHMGGANLMGGGEMRHTPSQQRVVDEAFGGPTSRPNDRIRAAGPAGWWPATFGSSTKVMVSDGDKAHHFHPTRTYTVQIKWTERVWKTCWAAIVPYPCSNDVIKTAEKTVTSQQRKINLKMTLAYGVANLVQRIACAVGITSISTTPDSNFRFCDATLDVTAAQFLPTLVYTMPFQEISVPASQWMTTYYWRFKTDNGRYESGYTGWSSFFRAL